LGFPLFLIKKNRRDKQMSNLINSSDLYECALYQTQGYVIEAIRVVKENKKDIAVFTFSGKDIKKTQLEYFNGTVSVNLLDFRKSYMHLSSLIGTAKKEAKQQENNSNTPFSKEVAG
jgi:hypothetical protein